MKYLATALLLSASLANAADLSFSDARARAVPPTADISAAFMAVTNNADSAVAMVSAESSIAETVELHTNSMVDGKMKMRRIAQIDIDANAKVELKPGGLHVMFIGLKKPLVMGETVDLKINLSDGTSQELQLPIVHIEPMMKKMNH